MSRGGVHELGDSIVRTFGKRPLSPGDQVNTRTPVIRNATSPPPDQPHFVFPNTDWACEACTHPNKGGKMCTTCQTPPPKRHKFVAPTKPPPLVVAAPPPAIEMAAASTDPLPAAFPGTPRARGDLHLQALLRRPWPP